MTNRNPLRPLLEAADPLDRSALVPLDVLTRAADELDELHARIEAATDRLQTEFDTRPYVGTRAARIVHEALDLLAGEPDGADL